LTEIVLRLARRSVPPIASIARSTRLCSRLGVAQETTIKALESARSVDFMEPLPRMVKPA